MKQIDIKMHGTGARRPYLSATGAANKSGCIVAARDPTSGKDLKIEDREVSIAANDGSICIAEVGSSEQGHPPSAYKSPRHPNARIGH
jgi:hypothetical protein